MKNAVDKNSQERGAALTPSAAGHPGPSWSFSLIFSGLLAREVAHRVAGTDNRALGAAAYLGIGSVWALGLSSSGRADHGGPGVAAFHTRQGFNDAERTIYMDGRPHPPATAPHSWGGFSTAVWEGNMLIITTTHMKAFVHRRNGVPSSDKRS